MASNQLKSLAAGFSALGLMAAPFTGNALAEDQRTAPEQTIVAADAENVNFRSDRNFIIRYNPNAEGHSPTLFRDTISDIQLAGCNDVELQTRRYGADYTLKAPWFRGGNSFTVDDIGTVGGIAIDLCQDGDLGSGPA